MDFFAYFGVIVSANCWHFILKIFRFSEKRLVIPNFIRNFAAKR